jgi:hypothetical protein
MRALAALAAAPRVTQRRRFAPCRCAGAAAAPDGGVSIGVDFGTTNSAVASVSGRTPRILAGPDGARTTPSAVSFLPGGGVLVGAPAVRAAAANPASTFTSVKRVLGRAFDEPAVGEELALARYAAHADAAGGVALHCPALGHALAPEAVAALVLHHMGGFAQAQLGAPPPWSAVLAVPARFNDAQRQATLAAAEAAGLRVLRLINEPTAAALAYGFGCEQAGVHGRREQPGSSGGGSGDECDDDEEEELVLVYDLGGGTLDVSLLDVGSGVFEVLASCGDARLGGDDFDAELARWLRDQPGGGAAAPTALLALAEAAKVALSEEEAVAVALAGGIAATLTRELLETRCAHLLQRCAAPLHRVLQDARRSGGRAVRGEDLRAVLLVGGATRMPAVRALVRDITGQARSSLPLPARMRLCLTPSARTSLLLPGLPHLPATRRRWRAWTRTRWLHSAARCRRRRWRGSCRAATPSCWMRRPTARTLRRCWSACMARWTAQPATAVAAGAVAAQRRRPPPAPPSRAHCARGGARCWWHLATPGWALPPKLR